MGANWLPPPQNWSLVICKQYELTIISWSINLDGYTHSDFFHLMLLDKSSYTFKKNIKNLICQLFFEIANACFPVIFITLLHMNLFS